MKPEVGKTYDVAARVTVVSVGDGEYVYYDSPSKGRRSVVVEDFTWTEVEPEYVVGALYEDAAGNVWKHVESDDDDPWLEPRNGGYSASDDVPKRPLVRLFREGER